MNRYITMNTIKRIVGVAAVAATPLLLLAGCSAANLQSWVTNTGCKPGPVVFLIPDDSASTASQREPGGPYETEMVSALKAAAGECADVYSAPADANSLADGSWVIGRQFRQTIGGNATFSAAARETDAQGLLPKVRQELHMGNPAATDLLGSLQRIKLAIDSLHTHREVQVVLLTDGVANLPGVYSMYTTPLDTPTLRSAFVHRLAQLGELPDFGGNVDVYIAGVGVGVASRDKAKSVIATWQALVPAMQARLESIDATLRFP